MEIINDLIIMEYGILILSSIILQSNNRIKKNQIKEDMKIMAPKYINQKSESELSTLIKFKKKQLEKIKQQNITSKNILNKIGQQNKYASIRDYRVIEKFQEELQKLEFKLNSEIKKNKLLKSLNEIMQQEVINRKKIKELQNWQLISNKQKQIKKQEYDTEQILQKHNQQIAKINILRQQVCAERSERVVYSNLFKKLQHQIKFYEQEYKDTLLEALNLKNKKNLIVEQIHQKKKNLLNNYSRGSSVLTNQIYQTATKKNSNDNDNFVKQKNCQNMMKVQIGNINKKNNLLESAEELENFKILFQKMKLESNVDSIDDLINQIQNLQNYDDTLVNSIEILSNQIQQRENILKIGRRPFQSFCETTQQHKFIHNPQGKINELDYEIQSANQQAIQYYELLSKVGLLLNVQTQIQGNQQPNNIQCFLKQVQEKFTQLKFLLNQNIDDSYANKQTEINDMPVELLQKLEKYGDCEKILTKDTFKQQYHSVSLQLIKQINKIKKIKIKK